MSILIFLFLDCIDNFSFIVVFLYQVQVQVYLVSQQNYLQWTPPANSKLI